MKSIFRWVLCFMLAIAPSLAAESGPEGGNAPSIGSADAPVTVEEYFRFGCGVCRQMQPVINELAQTQGGKVRIVFRMFPGDGEPSKLAAVAALAAQRQGKFDAMRETLFEHQPGFEEAQLRDYARQCGLDMARFESDTKDPALLRQVDALNEEARAREVTMTPTFFVNGEKLTGKQPLQTFLDLAARAPASAAQPASNPARAKPLTWDQLIYPVDKLDPVTAKPKLKIGDRAPDFALPSIAGHKISLPDYRGKIVVLSFVPAAWTPVCSAQWPHYIEAKDKFDKLGAVVLGITTDNIPTLYAWTRGMGELNFPVLSDFWPHGAVAKAYGVLRPESGTCERALFVIDPQGIVRYANVHDINSEPSLDELLLAIQNLAKK